MKPEWLEDELLAFAPLVARVASIGLVLLADDYGNGRANVAWLRGQLFPGDEGLEGTREALKKLEELRFVTLYEVEGQSYFSIRNWEKHQKVDRPGKPRVPGPPTKAPKKPREKSAKEPEGTGNPPEGSENTRESVAKIREEDANNPDSLATDLDLDHDLEKDQEGEGTELASASPPPKSVAQHDLERRHIVAFAKSFAPTQDARSFPVNFEPSEENTALATRLGLTIDDEIAGLRNHAQGKGKVSCAWHAELDTWLRRSAKFARGSRGSRTPPLVQPNSGTDVYSLVPQE